MADWEAIRQEHEQTGQSLRTLALKYDVPKSSVIRRAQLEGWAKGEVTQPAVIGRPRRKVTRRDPVVTHTDPLVTKDPTDTSPAAIAVMMLSKLAGWAEESLDLKDHKLFADALNQYYKILAADAVANPTQESQALDASLMAFMTDDEIQTLEEIVAAAKARKEEAESNVTPFRKSS